MPISIPGLLKVIWAIPQWESTGRKQIMQYSMLFYVAPLCKSKYVKYVKLYKAL
jgi:hypothetical protein